MEIKPGARVNRYELKRRLGKGGQGSVWEASDVLDGGAPRALKLIALRELEKGAAERAWREAQALQGVTHPGLVPCRELFRDSVEDLIGLVFDLVQGQSLAAAARDPRMRSEYREAVLQQLAAVLAHVHGLGIVHRDLKPDNVLVTDAFWSAPFAPGGVKLVDFGISAPAGNPSPITTIGGFVGTIPYLPPELMIAGPLQSDREGFARDVFAFGVLGWELLFGGHPTGLPLDAKQPAYRDVYLEAWEQRRAWPPPSPDAAWIKTLRACLALDPRRRPVNGGALLDVLRTHSSISGATDTHAPPTAAHIPPTSAQTPAFYTEGMRVPPISTPPVPPTAGMPYPTPPIAAPPYPQAPPPPPQVPMRGPSPVVLFVALGLAAVLGAFAFWMFTREETKSNEAGEPPIALSLRAATTLSPNVIEAPADIPLPCCDGREACPSTRACNPGVCQEKQLLDTTWRLRVTGVSATDGNRDLTGTNPRASVCMRNERTGENVCAPLSKVALEGGDRVNRLRAGTKDLAYGRIFVRVVENNRDLYPETRIAGNPEGFKTSALCRGVRLRVGPRDSAPVHVFVYLD